MPSVATVATSTRRIVATSASRVVAAGACWVVVVATSAMRLAGAVWLCVCLERRGVRLDLLDVRGLVASWVWVSGPRRVVSMSTAGSSWVCTFWAGGMMTVVTLMLGPLWRRRMRPLKLSLAVGHVIGKVGDGEACQEKAEDCCELHCVCALTISFQNVVCQEGESENIGTAVSIVGCLVVEYSCER